MKITIGTRLKELRGDLCQSDMAARLGTKQSTYSAWERGERHPDIETMLSIVSMFDISADWLLGVARLRRESSPEAPASGPCQGCAERDARIDKLLDILHRGSVLPGSDSSGR